MMNRRNAIKQLGMAAGGLALFPSCDLSSENVSRVMDKFQVTESQDALMKVLVDTILPESDIPGAISLKVDEFIWVMADDCLNQERQMTFLNGLKSFDKTFSQISDKRFENADITERIEVLDSMESGSIEDVSGNISDLDQVRDFVKITKDFTLIGFMQSEYVMKEVMPYPLIPGKNPSCSPIGPDQKINING